MKNKTQRITWYKTVNGIVYETEQYNSGSDNWYTVGDCSENKEFIETQVEMHNLKLI